jgi:protein O-GlcNAc transferase
VLDALERHQEALASYDQALAIKPDDVEALALRLAREPALLAGLRERLARNRLTRPLFDSKRYCGHIEAAYTRMWELWQRGESPQSFS